MSPISDAWDGVGGGGGSLGRPVTGEFCGLATGGCGQHFENGSIYWSAATGAHIVKGRIKDKWSALGWELGYLGYPISDEVCGLRNGGCSQDFVGGSIHWTLTTDAHASRGAIRERWRATGEQGGLLGYPITDEICGIRDGGCFQHFEEGSIYWTPASGAHFIKGRIWDRWEAMGWETSYLRYPITDEICGMRNGGCFQHFQGGSIYWSPATDGRSVRGAIRDRWAANGWETGFLGYPTTDEMCGLVNGGCSTHFEGGSIYWSPATGAHFLRGIIRDRYAMGWEREWGYPTSDEICGLRDGACYQRFERQGQFSPAWLYWIPNAHSTYVQADVVRGRVLQAWSETGYENGPFGYPAGDPRDRQGYDNQLFEHGQISASLTTSEVKYFLD